MTLLLIVGAWLLAAVLTAGLFAILARAGRQPEPTPDLPRPEVHLPHQRTAPADAPSLEGSH